MRYIGLILLFTCAAFAQVTDGITTSVSRGVSLAPDEADFTVSVYTALDSNPRLVAKSFLDAGIQNPVVTIVGIGQFYSYATSTNISQAVYQVTFSVPPSALRDAAKKLEAMLASLPEGIFTLQYNAYLAASQSVVDAAHQAALPQLLSDARTKAQTLAAAAGLNIGAIQGIVESGYGALGGIVGNFVLASSSPAGPPGTSSGASITSSPYTFYASVKFAIAP